MPAGAKPGERRGGRGPGTLNQPRYIETQMIGDESVQEIINRANPRPVPGQKLAKEVLGEFMAIFAGMAAYYQPLPPSTGQTNPHADEARFRDYASMAMEAAKQLAKYQSPQFRAIAVLPPPPVKPDGGRRKRFTLEVFDHLGARVYDVESAPPRNEAAALPAPDADPGDAPAE